MSALKASKELGQSFFQMGEGYARASINVDAEYAAMIGESADIVGTPAGYKALRARFVAGCVREGMKEKTAENRWALLFRMAGVPKPQSDGAKRQARHAAKKAAQANPGATMAPDAPEDDDAPQAPASGVHEAGRVMMELMSSEAHLIHLLRAGKLAEARAYLEELGGLAAKDAAPVK